MSSGTSTEAQGFQPRHFFVIVTMLAATAAVLVARETSVQNLLLVSATVMAVGLVAMGVYRTLMPLAAGDARGQARTVGGRTRLALEREKLLVLRSIKELEFDRAMGKIAEGDFQEMAARLRGRAIGLMKQLDQHDPDWRTEIEREVERRLAARGGHAAPAAPGASRSAPSRTERPTAGVTCADCGTINDTDARFCKRCGTKLGGEPA